MSDLCVRCKARSPRVGLRCCAVCAARSKENATRRRRERRAQGLCYRCARPSPGRVLCEACRAKVKRDTLKRDERKELAGECHDCPKPRTRGIFCEVCYAKSAARAPTPKRVLCCAECGEPRHNARTCPQARRAA